MKVGVISTSAFNGDRDFDPKVSYWTVLKKQYLKDNPDVVIMNDERLEKVK
jgi:hypothetical protein